jgi:hypothetical protein
MPAVRSASGPISAPACDAPISIGTPSNAMCAVFAESDIGATFGEIAEWAKRGVRFHQEKMWINGQTDPAPVCSPMP